MKRLRKAIVALVALAVVLIVVALVAVTFFMGPLVKSAVAVAVPEIAGVEAELAEADVSIWSGEIDLKGLKIGNPEGFEAEYSFELAELNVDVDPGSVFGATVLVHQVAVSGAEVTLVLKGTETNIERILANMKSAGNEEPEPAADAEEKVPKKVIIEHFVFEKSKVHLGTALAAGEGRTVSLPRIELRNIGRGSGDVTAVDAAAQIVAYVVRETVNAVLTSGMDLEDVAMSALKSAEKDAVAVGMELLSGSGEEGEALAVGVGAALKSLSNDEGETESSANEVGEAVEGLGEALGL